MTVKIICCLGLGRVGVPLSAIIATKCPEIKVTVVQTDAKQIFLWNAKQIPSGMCAPGLWDLIRKCQNKNLFFTTNDEASIKEADMIFIVSESTPKSGGDGENRAVDLSAVEEGARLIAEYSESDKIVVENSAVPLRAAECVRNFLTHNGRHGIRFQVLSNPEFYEEGSEIQNLLFPDRVLIGCEDSPEGIAAAKELSFIYERWVLPQNILIKDNWTVELSKITSSAFAEQRLANVYALSAICEETGTDLMEIVRITGKHEGIIFGPVDPRPDISDVPKAVSYLIYMSESLGMPELAAYWRQVLEINDFHRKRFLRLLIWTINQTVLEKRVAVMGFAYFKDTIITKRSIAVGLSKCLVEEKAILSIYDPNVNKSQVLEDLRARGCTDPNLEKMVFVYEDPYKAAFQTQVIIVCTKWPEFAQLDYRRIFAEMEKPAYLFDIGNILSHVELQRIGFKVLTVGKDIKIS